MRLYFASPSSHMQRKLLGFVLCVLGCAAKYREFSHHLPEGCALEAANALKTACLLSATDTDVHGVCFPLCLDVICLAVHPKGGRSKRNLRRSDYARRGDCSPGQQALSVQLGDECSVLYDNGGVRDNLPSSLFVCLFYFRYLEDPKVGCFAPRRCPLEPVASYRIHADVRCIDHVIPFLRYPDSPKANNDICNKAQVACITSALDFVSAAATGVPAAATAAAAAPAAAVAEDEEDEEEDDQGDDLFRSMLDGDVGFVPVFSSASSSYPVCQLRLFPFALVYVHCRRSHPQHVQIHLPSPFP